MKVVDYLIKKRQEDNKVYKNASNEKRIKLIKYVLN